MNALALLLADGRFPAGGHAHSGGVEAAVMDARISDDASLSSYLAGRLATAGRVAAGLAAAAGSGSHPVLAVDLEAGARIASPALRVASAVQGRQLLRAARALGFDVPWKELHHAVAMGAVARAGGLGPTDAARWAAHESVTGAATAAIRLLGLDPFTVWNAVAALAPAIDELAASSAAIADGPLAELPARSAPLLDIGAERHACQEVRLFAS